MISGAGTTTCRSKRPGRKQRGIEHVGAVGRGDEDDALVRLEAVHLDQELVQRLLALVIAAAKTRAAMPANRVDFVDEDDARRVLLRLLEHVADTARANAHEHFHEVGARDGEERHVGLAGDGAGQKRLAGAGRADQERAARDAPAKPLEFLWIAQELDDFLQIVLGLVHARHVVKGYAALLLGQKLCLRLAETERPAAARLHLAHEEHPDRDQKQHREPIHEHAKQRRHVLGCGLRFEAHVLVVQALNEIRIVGHVGLVGRAAGQRAGDLIAGNDHGAHVARVDIA